jgi:hypothetical protein
MVRMVSAGPLPPRQTGVAFHLQLGSYNGQLLIGGSASCTDSSVGRIENRTVSGQAVAPGGA